MPGEVCRSLSRRGVGLVCIAAVVLIWVSSSELIQFIFDEIEFEHPLFLTFYSTSLFSVYLLGFLVIPSWRESRVELTTIPSLDAESTHSLLNSHAAEHKGQASVEMIGEEELRAEAKRLGLNSGHATPKEVLKLAATFVPFWLAANWTFNLSLCVRCGSGTSVLIPLALTLRPQLTCPGCLKLLR